MNYFIPSGNDGMAEFMSQAMAEVASQTEETILSQLNEFVSRGLLTVERTTPLLVADPHSTKLTVKTKVQLKIKDQEYIESLERQVKELSGLVATLRSTREAK